MMRRSGSGSVRRPMRREPGTSVLASAIIIGLALALARIPVTTRAETSASSSQASPPRPQSNRLPSYQECVSTVSTTLQYCNMSLSIRERVSSLVSSMTLEEKVGQLGADPALGGTCLTITSEAPRIGLGRYLWLVETNSQTCSACIDVSTEDDEADIRCATAFPGALGLASTFNRTVWSLKGEVLSTELRALNNAGGTRGNWPPAPGSKAWYPYAGLTGFGPNINVARDPRFGRTSELPGEDPFLNGEYAVEYMRALQEVDDKGYAKILAFAKHFTAYSRETDRGSDSYNVSLHDYFDTYLPQYEAAMTRGGAAGVMCSYNAENGIPSCANDFLLNEVMRKKWSRPDAIVFTDCGAVNNMKNYPAHAPDDESAVSWTIGNGTDVEAGSTLWRDQLPALVKNGQLEEEVLDGALTRIFTAHMRTGRFDDPSKVSWTRIPASTIGSPKHHKIRDDAARQSAVLLRNEGNLLPLSPGRSVILVGPVGDDGYALMPDYFGDQVCPRSLDAFECVPTFLTGLKKYNGAGGKVDFIQGVDEISTFKYSGYGEALKAVKSGEYDLVVLAMGISKRTENEAKDRGATTLPGLQDTFAREILSAAADVGMAAVMVLTNGGALSVDGMLPPRDYSNIHNANADSAGNGKKSSGIDLPDCYKSRHDISESGFGSIGVLPAEYAVVEGYNPSFGANEIVAGLYGDGPIQWGRMVTTMYPAAWAESHRMDQYDMAADGGKTYRYHRAQNEDEVVLATFGEGMPSEQPDEVSMKCSISSRMRGDGLSKGGWRVICDVTNNGDRPVSALAMLYVRPSVEVRAAVNGRFPVPLRSLRSFERVMVGGGMIEKMGALVVTEEDLLLVNEKGKKEAVMGVYHVDIWDGWRSFASFEVTLVVDNEFDGQVKVLS